MVQNRTRLITWLIIVALIIGAGIGVATYIKGATANTPTGGTTGPGGETGQATPLPDKPGGTTNTTGQEQQVAQECLDVKPEPVRFKFNDKNLPTGKLGEWVDVKNEQGQTIMRVKVDLEDAIVDGGTRDYKTGKEAPGIRALFRLTLNNLTCHPFEWKVRHRQGLWLGVRPPIKESETFGWVNSAEILPADGEIMVAENGEFVYAEGAETRERMDKILHKRYGLPIPQEFPEAFPPGETSGQFYIRLVDMLGRTTFGAIGPNGDFHLPLVLGGYMGFAKIDLGKATDWFAQFFDGDPTDPKWFDPAQSDIENFNRKHQS